MTKFMANVCLVGVGLMLQLANYWFTFGLWPISWTSFVGCGIGFLFLVVIRTQVEKEK